MTNDVSTNSLQPEGVRQAKEGLSMSLWTAEDYDPLPPGLYVGELSGIESRESTNGEYRRWGWEILEGPYAGRKVYANTSTNFGPQAKARQWVENIADKAITIHGRLPSPRKRWRCCFLRRDHCSASEAW